MDFIWRGVEWRGYGEGLLGEWERLQASLAGSDLTQGPAQLEEENLGFSYLKRPYPVLIGQN